jgi:hypothetical protein
MIFYFDEYGNLFLKNELANKLYDFVINNKNEIELSEINLPYNIINKKKDKLKLVNDPTSLKGRVMKRKKEEDERERENNPDDDAVNSDDEYEKDVDDNYDKYYKEDEEYFYNNSDDDDYNALYETFIYEGTQDNGKLIFVSKLENSVPIYRMLVYLDENIIHFRPIGSKNKKFNIMTDENNNLYTKIITT